MIKFLKIITKITKYYGLFMIDHNKLNRHKQQPILVYTDQIKTNLNNKKKNYDILNDFFQRKNTNY